MISIIAAIGRNGELGKDNELLWHIKEDLINFKNITMGKKIVMGTNTYKSLPKKLDGREYIVLSHSLNNLEDVLIFDNFEDLINYLNMLDEEVMIIGGASIYKLFLPYADKLYLTEIDDEKEADVFFPQFNLDDYNKEVIKESEENGINFKFVRYRRRIV